jgi:hypothetical protein
MMAARRRTSKRRSPLVVVSPHNKNDRAQAQGTGSNPNRHPVQGHTTTGGTYVQPHQQTNPNSTQTDNYGTRGNVNPSTGTGGTRTPK